MIPSDLYESDRVDPHAREVERQYLDTPPGDFLRGEALPSALRFLDDLILRTPTGPDRDGLTEVGIVLRSISEGLQ